MTRDLTKLTLPQLIALGCQNKIQMKHISKRMTHMEYLIRDLNKLEVIKGLETKENGQPNVAENSAA